MQRKQQAASGQGGESGSIFASRARPVYFNPWRESDTAV
jgi:hypothetical protein